MIWNSFEELINDLDIEILTEEIPEITEGDHDFKVQEGATVYFLGKQNHPKRGGAAVLYSRSFTNEDALKNWYMTDAGQDELSEETDKMIPTWSVKFNDWVTEENIKHFVNG